MVIQEKMENAMKYHHEKQAAKEETYKSRYGKERLDVEKGDITAMVISAFLMLVPAVLVILLLMVGVGYFFLLH